MFPVVWILFFGLFYSEPAISPSSCTQIPWWVLNKRKIQTFWSANNTGEDPAIRAFWWVLNKRPTWEDVKQKHKLSSQRRRPTIRAPQTAIVGSRRQARLLNPPSGSPQNCKPEIMDRFIRNLSRNCTGLSHHTRHERTRYVSSRNQIYGGNFEFNEKYIPFVHFWEKPLQVLESSMKIPKKLSSRPLFSWDLPISISTYTPSRKTSTTESAINLVTENLSKEPTPPDADGNAIPYLPKTIQKSRSDRAKASAVFPESFGLIPLKKKKSTNWKKSIKESEKLKEFVESKKTSVEPVGRLKKRKKLRKNRKGKLDKIGKRTKTFRRIKEMNEVSRRLDISVPEPEVRSPCEMLEEKCEHRCKEANGKAVCVCFRGFTLEGGKCLDVNECETNNGECNGRCVNTIGSRKCICSTGFRLNDGVCNDVNECLLRNGHGPCQDQCINTVGSYYCTCEGLPGTTLSSNKHTCEPTQTCNVTSAGCSHTCINLSGRAFCTCPDGWELGDDWKTCHDIDECSNPEDYDVRCEFGCVNTIGSYTCANRNETSLTGANSE